MKKLLVITMAVAFAVMMAGAAMAASTGTQTVTFTIPAVNEIATSGTAVITVTTPAAGSDMAGDYASTGGTYSFTTNKINSKITAQLTSGGDMPSGTHLYVVSSAPSSTTAPGWTVTGGIPTNDISTTSGTAIQIASGGKGYAAGTSLTYTLRIDAGTLPDAAIPNKTVTLTITQ